MGWRPVRAAMVRCGVVAERASANVSAIAIAIVSVASFAMR